MEKSKKIVILLILAVIFIIIALLVLFMITNHKEENTIVESGPQDGLIEISQDVTLETNDNQIYTVQHAITKFLSYVMQENKIATYSILDDDYKVENSNINVENVISLLKKEMITRIYSQEMYVTQNQESATYYVFVYAQVQGQSPLQPRYYKVRMYYENETFSVEPSDVESFTKAKNKQVKIEKIKLVENNYNHYEYQNMTTNQMLQSYLDDYLAKAKANPEMAYERLADETKQANYPSIEEYRQYVTQNQESLLPVKIVEANREMTENGFIYTGKDEKGRSYQVVTTGGLIYTISMK